MRAWRSVRLSPGWQEMWYGPSDFRFVALTGNGRHKQQAVSTKEKEEMAGRHTPQFRQGMIGFYKTHKNATHEQAKKKAKTLGYDAYSEAAHKGLRKLAQGKGSTAKAGKSAGSEPEPPDRAWMDLSTGKFYTDFDAGTPGTRVAIYERVAVGGISLAYPQGK